MSSSEPVFSSQGDPFPSPVRGRTHYCPSKTKPLTEDQKQSVLSPSRLYSLSPHLSDSLSPPDLSFLGGIQRLVSGAPESDSSGPFDESWPSTDGSSSKTPERDERLTVPGTGQVPYSTEPSSQDSVIARYLERFRSGRPTSRLDRSPPSVGMKDFWWLQTSPDSLDVVRNHSVTGVKSSTRFSPHKLEMSPPCQDMSLSDSKLYSNHVDILSLQEKAGKLILQSESSLSSVGAVSSEGIGSSPSSNVSSTGSDQSRQSFAVPSQPVPSTERRIPALTPAAVGRFSALAPENDILYQWRLRRKMEQAREGTLAPPTQKRTFSPPVRIPKQVPVAMDSTISEHFRESQKVTTDPSDAISDRQDCIPSSCLDNIPIASPSLSIQTCTVPPHFHLQCDILPYVHGHPSLSCITHTQEKERVKPGDPHPLPPDSNDLAKHHQKLLPTRKPKKMPCPQPDLKLAEQQEPKQVERKKEKQKQTKLGLAERKEKMAEHVPLGPSFNRAVGEVISERLFSPSPTPQPKAENRNEKQTPPPSPPPEKQAPPPSPPSNQLQPLEIAAQLLEEAEDSDGTDFEDDPLLHVLREHRKALRRRLLAVNERLSELEAENRAAPSPLP
ncbi:proline and serine-rich protein 3 [Xenopus laevis]|uniref:Proline and serine-rich protein 3 n=2 Tax=Xenopus laevis TaxID=8355 RepID=A0A1L8FPH9_XENLA|nr:proline and serine-rich protein 3 [Xenopus laevis]XP_041425770.1 proline and serine-rich protein 3 [Xenopus laevis]OCT73489.1 hypothetical protein XELAEV_18036466mg [Xenopus laevis]